MAVDRDAVASLQRSVLDTIGDAPGEWPGGYPEEIEAALIDAVYSVRARYGNREKKTGVYGAVSRWREHRGSAADDLNVLAGTDPDELAGITNHARLAGRSKAEVVIEAARTLCEAGVVNAADLRANPDASRRAYLSVKGCGPVTWAYLRMLLGLEDVKADTWVTRFVLGAVPSVATHEEAAELVKAVAANMGVDERCLDHAIWSYQRSLRR